MSVILSILTVKFLIFSYEIRIGDCRSAVVDYLNFNRRIPTDIDVQIKNTLKGYGNVCGCLKRSGIMPKTSGKSVLTTEAFLILARKMLLLLEPSNSGGALAWASKTFGFCYDFFWHTTARQEGIETLLLEGLS